MVTRKAAAGTPETAGGDIGNSNGTAGGADDIIAAGGPYSVHVRITGVAALLMHRWSSDSVEAKRVAPKGSQAKRDDDVESYVYRDENNLICLPGKYLYGSVCGPQGAAKYRQDPRSPRKSALDLFKAGISVTTELAPIASAAGDFAGGKTTTWDYLDRQRVTVQRSGVTRVRPAFLSGWQAEFDILVLLPQYISPDLLQDVLVDAGRLVGVADYRPTYGRFNVSLFEMNF